MDKEKIIQYALGNIQDVDERSAISQAIIEDKEAREFYISIKNTYAITKGGDVGKGLDEEYMQLSRRIKKPIYRSLKTVYRYAAMLIAVIGISYLMFYFGRSTRTVAMNEVICPAGQIAEVKLSDGTHVWLNAESSVRYPSSFSGKIRELELQGEAFFDVKSDIDHPFVVKTDNMQVKVTGTSFNVNAYNGNDFVETTLVEGKVELLSQTGKKIVSLKPGEQATYDPNRKLANISTVDTRFYSSWKEGKMSFYNEELEIIMARLERWYNVDIFYTDDEIKKYKFSGTILKHKPLTQVLEIIKLSAPIDYQVKQSAESKNKVILTKQKK
ncbi:FecR family protein [Puteibacter caeruleilacunae]|nr:FecR family protein [Puteibacter caeruleilacunae]